jgi:PilZ domain
MSSSTPSPERRLFTRINFDRSTSITQGSNSWEVELIDLSLNGLLVREPDQWHIDTEKELTAKVTLDDDVSITMIVEQRHIEQGHIGFQCKHIDIDSISHLRRLVELNLGDLSLLERELASLGR